MSVISLFTSFLPFLPSARLALNYTAALQLFQGVMWDVHNTVCLHVSCWVHPCSAHVPAGVHICKQYTVHATHVAVCMFVCRGCDPRAWWWWELYLGGERTTFLLGLPASREWQMKQKNRITCTDISPRAGERPQRRMKKRVRLFKFQARLFAYVWEVSVCSAVFAL